MSGQRLREVREEREITGVELAERLGVHSSLIYKIETGARQPSARLFGQICRHLDLEKADLLLPEPDREAS